jgi:hypothetical protein
MSHDTAFYLSHQFFQLVSIASARQLALSLPQVEERSHFNLPDFRINKKIFASIHGNKNLMMVKLSPLDQAAFCSFNKEIIFPVPGGWGKHGSTFVDLKKVKEDLLEQALTAAWKNAAPPKLVSQYFKKN